MVRRPAERGGHTPVESRGRAADHGSDGTSLQPVGDAPRYAPPPPRPAVQRPELFDRLDRGVRGPLTLITGAPGSGKTLLLCTWLAARAQPGPAAWLSLEPMDGRPARFWGELLSAVREASGQELAAAPDPFAGSQDGFVVALARALETLPRPLILVLDDFERLHSQELTAGLDRLLRLHPEPLRLVIASRLDPGFSLQRQRLEGRLTELRSSDLALTRQQAGELFAAAGLKLTAEQTDQLHERTEGWAGGVR